METTKIAIFNPYETINNMDTNELRGILKKIVDTLYWDNTYSAYTEDNGNSAADTSEAIRTVLKTYKITISDEIMDINRFLIDEIQEEYVDLSDTNEIKLFLQGKTSQLNKLLKLAGAEFSFNIPETPSAEDHVAFKKTAEDAIYQLRATNGLLGDDEFAKELEKVRNGQDSLPYYPSVSAICEFLKAKKVSELDLDDLVLDMAEGIGSSINNCGLEDQVTFLIDQMGFPHAIKTLTKKGLL
jgi:hypothetical protein